MKRMVYDKVQQFCEREKVDMADTWPPMYGVASYFLRNKATIFLRPPAYPLIMVRILCRP